MDYLDWFVLYGAQKHAEQEQKREKAIKQKKKALWQAKKANLIAAQYIDSQRSHITGKSLNKSNSEEQFIKNYFNHNNWLYQPVTFRLFSMAYTPDFYDIERKVFIEVTANRQAYHQNKHKYKFMKKVFPGLFEIRTPDGQIFNGKFQSKGGPK